MIPNTIACINLIYACKFVIKNIFFISKAAQKRHIIKCYGIHAVLLYVTKLEVSQHITLLLLHNTTM